MSCFDLDIFVSINYKYTKNAVESYVWFAVYDSPLEMRLFFKFSHLENFTEKFNENFVIVYIHVWRHLHNVDIIECIIPTSLQQRYDQFENIVAEKPQQFPNCHLTDVYIFLYVSRSKLSFCFMSGRWMIWITFNSHWMSQRCSNFCWADSFIHAKCAIVWYTLNLKYCIDLKSRLKLLTTVLC